jgi:hypothetical protein
MSLEQLCHPNPSATYPIKKWMNVDCASVKTQSVAVCDQSSDIVYAMPTTFAPSNTDTIYCLGKPPSGVQLSFVESSIPTPLPSPPPVLTTSYLLTYNAFGGSYSYTPYTSSTPPSNAFITAQQSAQTFHDQGTIVWQDIVFDDYVGVQRFTTNGSSSFTATESCGYTVSFSCAIASSANGSGTIALFVDGNEEGIFELPVQAYGVVSNFSLSNIIPSSGVGNVFEMKINITSGTINMVFGTFYLLSYAYLVPPTTHIADKKEFYGVNSKRLAKSQSKAPSSVIDVINESGSDTSNNLIKLTSDEPAGLDD